MSWLVWRQHRAQVAIAAAIVAAFCLPVLITGRHLADALPRCRTANTCGALFRHYNSMNLLVDLSAVVPVLIGMFWGATIVGRELEAGTATLAWTQSVPRRRWIWTKLATLLGFTLACSAAVAGLVTWWSNSHNSVVESRFDPLQFDIQGVTPVGYAVFASAVGLTAGVLWRRTLPAMATTIGVFVGARLVVELWLRPLYASPVTKYAPFSKLVPLDVPPGSHVLSTDLMLRGHVVTGALPGHPCVAARSEQSLSQCMSRLGYQLRTVYQPAGRYWTFQWIEFGIFAGLAALLVVTAVIALRRRDA